MRVRFVALCVGQAMSVRLDKYLADAGVASRAASAAMIRAGRVQVDGRVERLAKRKLEECAAVVVDGRRIETVPLLLRYHKPVGVHCTMRDDRRREDLSLVVPRRTHPVGRLDADTSGLLLLSSRGELTHKLLHPKHSVEKEYVAECESTAPVDEICGGLAAGVDTALGTHAARVVDASYVDDRRLRIRLVVTEGKHRMVRRMLANLGAPVVSLRRDRFGPVLLGDDLPEGAVKPVTSPDAIRWAEALLDEQ